jgi:hypothetical protein
MPTNLDLNNLFDKYPKMIALFIIVVVAVVVSILYLVFNPNHNKLPLGIETNIPIDTSQHKQDTSINPQIYAPNNNGTVIGTQNNNYNSDTGKK